MKVSIFRPQTQAFPPRFRPVLSSRPSRLKQWSCHGTPRSVSTQGSRTRSTQRRCKDERRGWDCGRRDQVRRYPDSTPRRGSVHPMPGSAPRLHRPRRPSRPSIMRCAGRVRFVEKDDAHVTMKMTTDSNGGPPAYSVLSVQLRAPAYCAGPPRRLGASGSAWRMLCQCS